LKFLKDLDIEKVRLEEEKKIESLKDPSRSKDLSRLRELRQKIESITACFDRKESCLKKIISDIIKSWKKYNEKVTQNLDDSITEEYEDIGDQTQRSQKSQRPSFMNTNANITNANITNANITNANITINNNTTNITSSFNKTKDTSTLNQNQQLAKRGSNMFINQNLIQNNWSKIKEDKTPEELLEYFRAKLKLFKNTILTKKYEFENKKEHQLDKSVKLLTERVSDEDHIFKFFDNGAVEYISNDGNEWDKNNSNVYRVLILLIT